MNRFTNKVLFQARKALNNLLLEEDGDVNVISIVVLIGIALILLVMFRDQIRGILGGLLGQVEEKSSSVIS